MRKLDFVLFGGRAVGVACLEAMIEREVLPSLVVYNPDETLDPSKPKSFRALVEAHEIKSISFNDFNLDYIKNNFSEPPSVGCSAFATKIISKNIIDSFKLGITNMHFSLLPRYRGKYPTVYAIFNGETHSGVTLHWISEKLDLGDIITQDKIEITPDDTGFSLFNKCVAHAKTVFNAQVEYVLSGKWPQRRPQVMQPGDEDLLFKVMPNNGEIDWSWSGERIRNFLRATYHPNFPLPTVRFAGKEFQLVEEK